MYPALAQFEVEHPVVTGRLTSVESWVGRADLPAFWKLTTINRQRRCASQLDGLLE